MSWPSDGRPRYVLVETTGYRRMSVSGQLAVDTELPNRTVAILDRAFCHRVVFTAQSEKYSGGGAALSRLEAIAHTQRLAAARLAELNAEQVAA